MDLEGTWRDLGISADTLKVDGDGTIAPRARAITDSERALLSAVDQLELGEPIGRGGQAMIYGARQLGIDRTVAVKTSHPELGPAAAQVLIAEARVAGALEHPGVIPIYGVGTDGDGRPLIIMKRVVGLSWLDHIAARTTTWGEAELDAELDVFEQLCTVVAFAHSRAVLHRDIKPANVLLGEFGEIYLVDWGLAVGLDGAAIADLPAARDVREVAGSILYMAPEQIVGDGDGLGTHTDVYLLGATLYEVITGRPMRTTRGGPHAALLRAFSEPLAPLPDGVASELRAICDRARDPDPAGRYPSAAALRDAIAAFRRHREARELAARATLELTSGETLVASNGDPRAIDAALAAARFGFEQALRSWPESSDALDGRARAIVVAAEHELASRRPEAAAALLDALGDASRAQLARVELLRGEVALARARAAEIEREVAEGDLGVAARARRGGGLVMGGALLALHVVLALLDAAAVVTVDHLVYLVATSSVAFVVAIPTLAFHRIVFPNRAGRRFALSLAFMLSAQVAVFVALWRVGLPLPVVLAVSLVQLAGSLAIKTTALDPRVAWTAGVAAAAAATAAVVPGAAIVATGVAYATYFVAGAVLRFPRDGAVPAGPEATTSMS